MSLKDDKPVLELYDADESGHTRQLNTELARATEAMGGQLILNPFYAFMKDPITMHPIGYVCRVLTS